MNMLHSLWHPAWGITIRCQQCGSAYTLYPHSRGAQGGLYNSALDWCLTCEAPIHWSMECQQPLSPEDGSL